MKLKVIVIAVNLLQKFYSHLQASNYVLALTAPIVVALDAPVIRSWESPLRLSLQLLLPSLFSDESEVFDNKVN
jgi:hypothetical protein